MKPGPTPAHYALGFAQSRELGRASADLSGFAVRLAPDDFRRERSASAAVSGAQSLPGAITAFADLIDPNDSRRGVRDPVALEVPEDK
jgi:hypothetical protein